MNPEGDIERLGKLFQYADEDGVLFDKYAVIPVELFDMGVHIDFFFTISLCTHCASFGHRSAITDSIERAQSMGPRVSP